MPFATGSHSLNAMSFMRKTAFAVGLTAFLCLAAGCVGIGPLDARPESWRPWTDSPVAGDDAPRLSEMLVESADLKGSNAPWLAKWTTSPVSLPWTDATLELIVKYQQNPLRAARALTLVHVAMHDALVVSARTGVPERARGIAVHRAAGLVLAHLYPNETPGRWEGLGISGAVAVAKRHGVSEGEFARAFNAGSGAAEATIKRALTDGSGRVWPVRLRPAHKPGQWVAAPPLNIYDPAEAFAGEWRTWVLEDGGEIQPPPPVVFDSPEYWKEAAEVHETSKNLTPAQRRTAEDWHLDQGSVTPPGIWNRRAREMVMQRELDDAQAIRVFAVLNVAMMDSFIACWRAKFEWWTQRPVNAIRAGMAPEFLPALITPPFPSYVSGHASVSGAAAKVLGAFFPGSAATFDRAAEEAAESRLLGGIHFRSDNDQGLKLGYRIGEATIRRIGEPLSPK